MPNFNSIWRNILHAIDVARSHSLIWAAYFQPEYLKSDAEALAFR